MTAQFSTARPVVRDADDISALINAGPAAGSHARMVVALALGGVFLDAYDLTTLSWGITDVQAHFGLSAFQTGLVAAALNAGTIAGSLAGGWLTDRIGRYAVFMADMVCFVIAALVAGLAPTAGILIAARFAMGFGVGMDLPVAMAFLSEFSRLEGRGSKAAHAAAWCPTWYAASSACFVIVFVLSHVLPATHPDWLWRASLAFGAVPALAIILVRGRYMSESPVWIARRGDLARAADILRRSYGVDPIVQPARGRAPVVVQADPWRLVRKPLLGRGLLVCSMTLISAMSYNIIIFGLPTLLVSIMHASAVQVVVISILLNLAVAFPGGLLGVRLARSVRSRPIILAGYIMQVAGVGLLAVTGVPHGTVGVVAALAGFAAFLFAQGFGPGCQLMVYPTLSYPTELRGMGIGVARLVSGIGGTLVLLSFPWMNAQMGPALFWLVLLAPLAGVVITCLSRWDVFGYDPDMDPALRQPVRATQHDTVPADPELLFSSDIGN
ncbi:MFS transporter [Komagataeibacter rhaeticus]|uniref:MFS transporter n=1 Tax=Komagataeibacter rhaeticus TaxID=215221 RepID=UPI0004DA0D91|nr:MFS transporter [Komagataeibacter rhaeticus]KDU96204.1 major facilitator transporter [Komagataeibacter rhaeticus AF1]MBL7240664.1 MFS transporter [Komagataeibacter rhaeticus]PYD54391.1 MFS transporter [Komagataeibacter rhaeticus]GBQ14454.1 sugar transporter [Komagataeibacter rhaeticus DSM 16663]